MDGSPRSRRRPPPNAAALGRNRTLASDPPPPRPTVRRYLGIDPGLGGAVALLRLEDGGQSISITATPVDWVPIGTGKRRRYAIDQIDHLVRTLTPITFAYLEQQTARPGQGVTSTFTTGFGDGMWRALLTAHGIPHAVVTPQYWRKVTGVPALSKAHKTLVKNSVREIAARRFPDVAIKLDHADAVMLAVAAALSDEARYLSAHA